MVNDLTVGKNMHTRTITRNQTARCADRFRESLPLTVQAAANGWSVATLVDLSNKDIQETRIIAVKENLDPKVKLASHSVNSNIILSIEVWYKWMDVFTVFAEGNE